MKEYDINLKNFNFKDDLEYGERGEAHILSFIELLRDSQIEVKTDRYRNGKMVIETHQCPGAVKDEEGCFIWKPSGINVTTAKWWVYIYGLENGSFVAIPVDRLKRYIRSRPSIFCETKKIIFAGDSDNPAKGWLMTPHQVIDMMSRKLFDKVSE